MNRIDSVVLLGCVKTKRSEPAPARDLYISPLWRARQKYAEASGAPWFILSAKHGLVEPSEMIAPYEMSLNHRPARDRRAWGANVVVSLEDVLGEVQGAEVEIHAGGLYREAVRPSLDRKGAHLINPLAGLGIGQQLAWYDAQERRARG